jgi:hypothetical protein
VQSGVSTENLTFAMLVGLPLVAAVSLGLLMRTLVGGGRGWPVWLVVLAASCVVWGYYFSETP